MATPLVLIAGAGPTGMAMAIECRRAGLDVRIIDRSVHMARYSQALVVQARTLEQFERYGVAQTAVDQGRKVSRAEIRSEGRKILDVRLDGIPGRFPFVLFLPQSRTEAILNEHMNSLGATTERGTELVSFAQQEDGVAATLRHPDGREETVKARWLVGCDGAHSTVRRLSGIPFEGGGIDLSFFLGDLEIEGPDAPEDQLSVHLHKGDVVFLARLSDRVTRLIAVKHENQGKAGPTDLTLADFQQAVDQVGVRVRILSSEWMTPFHVNDRQARQYRAGSVFLAGDASHIHSPLGGQGMNTGIQDTANLGWKLAAVARDADQRLLDSYYDERGEVGRALLRTTERGLHITTTTNPVVEAIRDTLLPIVTAPKMVHDALVGFVSETSIAYRSSPVVRDSGGDGTWRAGDRLADLGEAEDWSGGRHRAVFVNAEEAETADVTRHLRNVNVTSIRSQGGAPGREKKLVILRPDGYIGFRGPLENTPAWQDYARQDGL